ncbi:MAG TPA: adenylate/guanylate cyclase domain-containing protein [Polyangia bacterium]|nr:adenylate/guanylate cyclase domain-containing protein [Polyangia bacterium]
MSDEPHKHTRHDLNRLLERRNEHPETLADIDREIWAAFGQTHALWVLDMSGFSRLTVRYGITHFLAMIHRLHNLVRPVLASHAGRVVKTEADNVFAVFPTVAKALAGAMSVHTQLEHANAFLPEDWDLHASIGIGFGEVLMLPDDFYGNELNLASKLGEDVAEAGETMLTDAAHARLIDEGASADVTFDRREVLISKMTLAAFSVGRRQG